MSETNKRASSPRELAFPIADRRIAHRGRASQARPANISHAQFRCKSEAWPQTMMRGGSGWCLATSASAAKAVHRESRRKLLESTHVITANYRRQDLPTNIRGVTLRNVARGAVPASVRVSGGPSCERLNPRTATGILVEHWIPTYLIDQGQIQSTDTTDLQLADCAASTTRESFGK
jgi:hypothetical protein